MASKKKTQKKEDYSRKFSEDELDAARQLVQLSCSSEEYEDDNKDAMSSSEASSALRPQHNHKIGNSNNDGDDNDNNDDDDGGLKRKIRRFRPVKSIYSSTKPLVVEFVGNNRNNKTKCKCN